MSLKEITAEIRGLYSYCKQNTSAVLTADNVPWLNNPDNLGKKQKATEQKKKHGICGSHWPRYLRWATSQLL